MLLCNIVGIHKESHFQIDAKPQVNVEAECFCIVLIARDAFLFHTAYPECSSVYII